MINPEIIYRIYDDVAILMNVKEKKLWILEEKPLENFKELTKGEICHSIETDPIAKKQFMEIGLFKDQEIIPTQQGSMTDIHKAPDMSVVNYWAFKNRIPISGHFELTSQCNLRCRHCYCLFKKEESLSTDSIIRIFEDLKENGVFGLVLTGGEIFYRKDIMTILEHLNTHGFVLRLNTNGTLIDEPIARKLADFKNIYRIHVSIYGSTPDVHDAITRVPGSFRKTTQALHLLKEYGLPLRINCSLMNENSGDYQNIETHIGDPLGVPVHYDPNIFPKDDNTNENQKTQLTTDQLEDFTQYRNTRKQNKGEHLNGPKKQKLCKAAFSFFSITHTGDIYPCLKMKRVYRNPLGNIMTDSFKAIWNQSEDVIRIRHTLDNKLRNCSICDLEI